MRFFHKGNFSIWLGLVIGILYGAAVRLIFTHSRFVEVFVVMSLGFIFVMPLTLGVLTVYFGARERSRGWLYLAFMPWVPCLVLLGAVAILGWEGSICIIMALPVFLVMSTIGGLFTGLVLYSAKWEKHTYSLLAVFIALPFIVGSIEKRIATPQSVRTAETQIVIDAAPAVVWQNIERVREIKPDEQRFSLVHLLGFPRPVEATLTHEGVGGVRHATFAGGVLFVETIDRWDQDKELSFAIKADTKSIPPTTLDEHVTVGGPYFDVLEGTYRIERLNGRQVVLHLSSKHRLSTRFNFYAGLWTDFIMRDIQRNILQIIKRRCEVGP